MRLRNAAAAVVAALALAVSSGAALAQTAFPTKPITLIVPWNAGGNTDLLYRAMGDAASP